MAAFPMAAQAALQWTERNPNAGTTGQPNLTQVIYAAGHYVAAGDGTIMESADGVTWTQVYHSTALGYISANVAYGNGTFVVAFGILIDDGTGNNITVEEGNWATSKDGVHWTATGPEGPPASDILFANGQFTIVGTTCGEDQGIQIQPDDTFFCQASDTETSSDGATWTSHSSTAAGIPFVPSNLGFANGLFIGFSPSGSNTETAYVSSDAAHWNAVATLGINAAGFGLGPIRTFGGTVYALSDQGYPVIATSTDEHAWHLVGYLWAVNGQGTQVRNKGHFDDMVSYGGDLLAPVVEVSTTTRYPMWLGRSDLQQWCELDGYPSSAHGVAAAVNGGQVVVVGAKGEILSTAPTANAEAVSCASGGETFAGDITADSTPVNGSGTGAVGPFALVALLGLASRRRRGKTAQRG